MLYVYRTSVIKMQKELTLLIFPGGNRLGGGSDLASTVAARASSALPSQNSYWSLVLCLHWNTLLAFILMCSSFVGLLSGRNLHPVLSWWAELDDAREWTGCRQQGRAPRGPWPGAASLARQLPAGGVRTCTRATGQLAGGGGRLGPGQHCANIFCGHS